METRQEQKKDVIVNMEEYKGGRSPDHLAETNFSDRKDIIVLNNVHKTYLLGIEGIPALRGVSLKIKEQEFVVILGTSGGGKTTLLNIIGTIDKPTKGDVWISGVRIKSSTDDKVLANLRLNYLSFVFQTFNLIGSLTALENVELPMILMGGKSRAEIRKRAAELLSKVGLKNRMDHFPNQLSGGEQQRVTIARALSNNPKVLLLDEPTGDLDTKNTDVVMDILVELNRREGITMVMVTHDVGLKSFANRVIRMLDGKVQRIEEVPVETRMASIDNLKRSIDAYGREEQAGGDQVTSLGVRQGVASGVAHAEEARVNPFTEKRKPTDYAAIHFQSPPAQ
eukprot:TRINITY_DN1541_c0_g1_i4.p1 TRINITY_DN1541_c0_g1~~TRINITY_DN1541_c0_g1_i4.p1  ORF type:complete len:339 (+),score=93.86 TRINITY_DN1541_c0_g1_i4:387-1403(+)